MIEEKNTKMPIFAERFNRLRGKKTQAEFAEFLGISRATVGFYENGDRIPDAMVLKQIAERCGVTTDYLVGLSDIASPDTDLQAVCKYTGLNWKSVEQLQRIRDNGYKNENELKKLKTLCEKSIDQFKNEPDYIPILNDFCKEYGNMFEIVNKVKFHDGCLLMLNCMLQNTDFFEFLILVSEATFYTRRKNQDMECYDEELDLCLFRSQKKLYELIESIAGSEYYANNSEAR